MSDYIVVLIMIWGAGSVITLLFSMQYIVEYDIPAVAAFSFIIFWWIYLAIFLLKVIIMTPFYIYRTVFGKDKNDLD